MISDCDLWEIIPDGGNKTTNCTMPRLFFNQAIAKQWKLPVIFKVTNPETDDYTICAADNFFDNDSTKIAMLPSLVINYLNLGCLAEITVVNDSLDLIPPIAKTIYLEPQSSQFYEIDDPQRELEDLLKDSHYLAQDYLIPIVIKNQLVNIKVKRIIDEFDRDTKYANIHNIDLNVEFLPLPVSSPPSPPPSSPPSSLPSPCEPKPWVPFGGQGRRLCDGAYISKTLT